MQVTIISLSNSGDGVAKSPEGKTLFIKGGVPQDVCEVSIDKDCKRYAHAHITHLISPSPLRVTPVCSQEEALHSCKWAHINIEEQRRAKTDIMKQLMMRLGGFDLDEVQRLLMPCIPTKKEWGYRNKIELQTAVIGGKLQLGIADEQGGFVKLDASALLPAPYQKLPAAISGALNYALRDKLDEIKLERVGIRVSKRTKELEIALWTAPGAFPRNLVAKILSDACKPSSIVRILMKDTAKSRKMSGLEVLGGKGCWSERLNFDLGGTQRELRYLFSAPSFFQVNTNGAEILIQNCLNLLQPQADERIFDLYSGAGSFTLPLALSDADVSAVESYGSSVRDLRRNLEFNGLEAEVMGGDSTREFNALDHAQKIVVDPPRSGLSAELVEALSQKLPQKLLYVSCDPATLMRDLKLFRHLGKLTPQCIIPVDMFPQTPHVETVCLMTRV